MEKGFILIELMIVVAIASILGALLFQIASGNSVIPAKQSCLDAGGTWSEGIQYGTITQLCTYN